MRIIIKSKAGNLLNNKVEGDACDNEQAALDELRAQLRAWSRHYYVDDDPQVPDAEYDRCFKKTAGS